MQFVSAIYFYVSVILIIAHCQKLIRGLLKLIFIISVISIKQKTQILQIQDILSHSGVMLILFCLLGYGFTVFLNLYYNKALHAVRRVVLCSQLCLFQGILTILNI